MCKKFNYVINANWHNEMKKLDFYSHSFGFNQLGKE